jgi:hypothetical protein
MNYHYRMNMAQNQPIPHSIKRLSFWGPNRAHLAYAGAKVSACFLLALSLACALPARAHNGPHALGTVPIGHGWDFTLPTLDGSRFVSASSPTGPVLVTFWGVDCAQCIADLPRLQAFAAAHPDWTVLLISTDAPARAEEFVQRHGIALTVLRPGANVAALMRSAGNRSGKPPFTVALRQGRLCDGQPGALAEPDLERIAARCTTSAQP